MSWRSLLRLRLLSAKSVSTYMALALVPVFADPAMHASSGPLSQMERASPETRLLEEFLFYLRHSPTQPDGPHPETLRLDSPASHALPPSTQPDGPHPETLFSSDSFTEFNTSSRCAPP